MKNTPQITRKIWPGTFGLETIFSCFANKPLNFLKLQKGPKRLKIHIMHFNIIKMHENTPKSATMNSNKLGWH